MQRFGGCAGMPDAVTAIAARTSHVPVAETVVRLESTREKRQKAQ